MSARLGTGSWSTGRTPAPLRATLTYCARSFLFVIEHMMPLCMVISWVYSVAMTIQHIVAEKEHRLKEVGGGTQRDGAPREGHSNGDGVGGVIQNRCC